MVVSCVVSLPAELCAPFHCRAHLILLLAVLAISCSHSRRIGCMQLCRNWLTFTTVNSGRYLVEVKCQVTGVDSRDQFYASKSYKTTHTKLSTLSRAHKFPAYTTLRRRTGTWARGICRPIHAPMSAKKPCRSSVVNECCCCISRLLVGTPGTGAVIKEASRLAAASSRIASRMITINPKDLRSANRILMANPRATST